ncbi:MAG: lamin tail domain-containing protein [Clostridia bacterium]|nr:lamin tail domain-containing protein [Clostridia bacterium]
MNNDSRRSVGAGTKVLLTILLIILAVAILIFVFLLLGKRGESNRGGNDPTANPQEAVTLAPGVTIDPNAEAPEALFISEVMRGDEGFAEIMNNSSSAVELSDYYLSDKSDKANKWQFPAASLEPGAYAVINLRGSEYTGSAEGGNSAGYAEFNANFKLSSTENGIYLFNKAGRAVDKLIFDVDMPKNVSAVRIGPAVAYTVFPTKGAENSGNVFTQLVWNPMDAGDPVRINEVLPSNKYDITDEDGDRSDWVELYNSSDNPVDLSAYCLSDDANDPGKWALPAVILQPHDYIVIFLSGKDRRGNELHTSFKLSSTDDGLFLSCYNGMRQDCITVPEELSPNISIGRGEDGNQLYYARPTPGEANSAVGFTDYMGVGGFNPSSVYISEVCAVTAPRSGEMDWVELYNGTAEAVSLSGWHISDSRSALDKYELSSVTIPAGGYAVVNCSSGIKDAWANPAPFSLSPSGETVYLSDADGFVVDVFESGALRSGVTSGRLTGTETGERVFFSTPSKGRQNPETCYLSYAAAPVFSESGLYHTAAFMLELSVRNADGVIHYTLDGTRPTEASPVYTGPIEIAGNTVIRAVNCVPGKVNSDISTATYLFEQPHTVPVVTIAMDPAEFREMYAVTEDGITAIEKEGFLQYFETDGVLGIETAAGFRVSGASTRKYPQKSLGVYFRSGYGRKTITYPFFGNDYVTTFGGLVLRNSGQDWGNARLRDSFSSKAVIGMNIDASESRFVVVYINGQYWGLYDLKENMNERYLESHYGVDPDTANVIKRNTYELEGSNTDFLRVRGFCVQNGTVIPMTDERYSQFTQWVDAESFADYLIARDYLRDADMFNQKYWRTTDYTVRWRAIYYDSDFALSSPLYGVLHSYFDVTGIPSANGSRSNTDIYCGLLSNENWRHYFIVRYIYVMNYYLNNDRLLPLFDSMVAEMEPEMNRHIARWNHPSSYSHWQSQIREYRSFLVERPDRAKESFMYVMGISSSQYAEYEREAAALYEQYGGVFQRIFE